jgi:hypothetical protein
MPVLVCNGMNRAGSTLQYNLARSLVEKCGLGQGEGFILHEQMEEYRPILQVWANDSRWHVMKAHDLPPDAAALTTAGRMYVCYIYRDIRGVAASYKRVWQVEGDKLLAELDQAVAAYYEVNNLPQLLLCQRYEAVLADLPGATRQVASFMGISPADELIEAIALECSAQAMQKVLQRLDWKLRLQRYLGFYRRVLRRLRMARPKPPAIAGRKQRIDQRTLLHPNHISGDGGAADSWRDSLSADEKALLTERYRVWLEEAGYLA